MRISLQHCLFIEMADAVLLFSILARGVKTITVAFGGSNEVAKDTRRVTNIHFIYFPPINVSNLIKTGIINRRIFDVGRMTFAFLRFETNDLQGPTKVEENI